MKTFKWTIPAPLPSAVEQSEDRSIGQTAPDEPTKAELKQFERWEKVRKKGPKSFIIRSTLSITAAVLLLYALHHFGVITVSKMTFPAWLGGPIGSLIGIYISWNRYTKKREQIQTYINRSELGTVVNASSTDGNYKKQLNN